MCLSNELIADSSDRDKEKNLRCERCGPKTIIIVHRISGRTMIQCVVCQRSVFDADFPAARERWEKGAAA